MEYRQCHPCVDRLWADVHTHAVYISPWMGGLPNHCGSRKGLWGNYGESLSYPEEIYTVCSARNIHYLTIVFNLQPMVAVQNILPREQIPLGMSLISFCQTFGGTLSLSLAQNVFTSSLREGLKTFAPLVDVEKVLDAGATGFRDVVRPGEVAGVIRAYDFGLRRIFYLAAALSVGCFVFAWGMGWYSVNAKSEPPKATTPEVV